MLHFSMFFSHQMNFSCHAEWEFCSCFGNSYTIMYLLIFHTLLMVRTFHIVTLRSKFFSNSLIMNGWQCNLNSKDKHLLHIKCCKTMSHGRLLCHVYHAWLLTSAQVLTWLPLLKAITMKTNTMVTIERMSTEMTTGTNSPFTSVGDWVTGGIDVKVMFIH